MSPTNAQASVPRRSSCGQAVSPVGADEIVAYVAERVAAHKRVHDVEFVDAIPTSPAGKTLRRMLRDRGGAQ